MMVHLPLSLCKTALDFSHLTDGPGDSRSYDRDRSRSPIPEGRDRDHRAHSDSPNGREAMDTRYA